jgi:hypothetical protein
LLRPRFLGSAVVVAHERDDPDHDSNQKEHAAELWPTPTTPHKHGADDENRDKRDRYDGQRIAVSKEALTGGGFSAILGNEEPPCDVQQDSAATKDGQDDKGDADQDGVDPKRSREAAGYPADHSGVAGDATQRWTPIGRLPSGLRG